MMNTPAMSAFPSAAADATDRGTLAIIGGSSGRASGAKVPCPRTHMGEATRTLASLTV